MIIQMHEFPFEIKEERFGAIVSVSAFYLLSKEMTSEIHKRLNLDFSMWQLKLL